MGSFTLFDEVCYVVFPIANFLRQSRRSRRPEADAKNRTEKFPGTTEISRFFESVGYQKFTDQKCHGFGRATRQVRSGVAGLALPVTLMWFGTVAVRITPCRSTQSGSPLDAGFPSYGSPNTTCRWGGCSVSVCRAARVWSEYGKPIAS
jgi:hypothetical protein